MAKAAVSSSELNAILALKSPHITVVKFGNNKTCPPCRASHPIFHHAAEKYSKKCNFVDVDLGAAGPLGQDYGIRSMPTFIYFVNGSKVNTVTGASSLETDIANFVQTHGKTIFETSQGQALGGTTTTSKPAQSTVDPATGRRQPPNNPNNPWAQKGFNPAQKMRQNAGITDEPKTTSEPQAEMVCEGDVCYMKPATTTNVATTQSTTQQQPPKSVCNSCTIM